MSRAQKTLPFQRRQQRITRILIGLFCAVSALAVIFLVLLNIRLYHAAPPLPGSGEIARDAIPQLRFLRGSIENGAPAEMQQVFPEGYFFMYALYGLSWVNLGLESDAESEIRQQAISEARWAYENLNTARTKSTFEENLNPPYGAFYAGWRLNLLAGLLLLQTEPQRPKDLLQEFQSQCNNYAEALREQSPNPYLQTYSRHSWPCDNIPGIIALNAHGLLIDDRYEGDITTWLKDVEARLDQATGLIPHKVDWRTGETEIPGRGLAQAVFLSFLPDLDPEASHELYNKFREDFIAYRAGLPAVLEYPHGVAGTGDVDSGPLIIGVSLSATTIAIAAARVHGDEDLARDLSQAGEALALPIGGRGPGGKRYFFGVLPIGDAWAVWAKTHRLWEEPKPDPHVGWDPVIPAWWKWPLHLVSLALSVVLILLTIRTAQRVLAKAGVPLIGRNRQGEGPSS